MTTPVEQLLEQSTYGVPLDLPPASLYPNALSSDGASVGDVVTVLSDGSVGFSTPDVTTLASISGILPVNQGGTGIDAYVKGDVLYAPNTNQLSKLGIGAANAVLKVSSGLPAWSRDLDLDSITMQGAINMNNNILTNIGVAGTDFSATGGLTLADTLTVSAGGITVTGDSTITGVTTFAAGGSDRFLFSYRQTSDGFVNDSPPPDAALLRVYGSTTNNLLALTEYNFGMSIHFRHDASKQLEFHGWDGSLYRAVFALLSATSYNEVQVRNQADDSSIQLGYPSGADAYIRMEAAQAGTDVAGANLLITGGPGTGAGTPGSISFQVAATLASGSTAQTVQNRLVIDEDNSTFYNTITVTANGADITGPTELGADADWPTSTIGKSGNRVAVLQEGDAYLVIANMHDTIGTNAGHLWIGARRTTSTNDLAHIEILGIRSNATSGNAAMQMIFKTMEADGTQKTAMTLISDTVEVGPFIINRVGNPYIQFKHTGVSQAYIQTTGVGALSILDENGVVEAKFLNGTLTLTSGFIASGNSFIGDTTNINATLGLTINQGANDDQIFAGKSSDVNTGLTSALVGTIDVEVDDFLAIHKTVAGTSGGGVTLISLMENVAETNALRIESYGGQADTTKSSAGRGLIEFYASQHDGANTLSNIAADGNLAVFIGRVGGTNTALWILGEDGDTWQGGGITFGGDLNHDGSNIGFFGVAPAVQAAAYTPTNVTPDRSYDANATSVEELADVLGTLVADLQSYGLLQ